MKRRNLLIAAPSLLSACATTTSVSDGTTPSAGQGILAVHLSANQPGILNFNPYGESSFGARFAENMFGAKGALQFIDGDRFLVVPVDAGQYMWSKLMTGNQYAWLLDSTRLQVRASTITYIGHIRIFVAGSKYSISVRDREDDMREHLQKNFPIYSKSMEFMKLLSNVRLGTP
jgi:hypothetical protein